MTNPTIIIPYRDRKNHLDMFIPAMNKYLPGAPVIVVEQADSKPFNRGKLFNSAYCEFPDFDYYVFHDVDKLPVKVNYSYPAIPTQLEKNNIQIKNYLGGVTMFNNADYTLIDGYSNNFWGWGGEDNQLYNQIIGCGLKIEYRNSVFKSLPHKKNGIFSKEKWEQAQKPRDKNDGIICCEYKLKQKEQKDGYILLQVEL